MTLEDETGYVNVVVWARLARALAARAVVFTPDGVAGKIEKQGEVGAPNRWAIDGSHGDAGDLMRSRDFH